MVAFNFQTQFADDVEAGRKTRTARQKQRCKKGDRIQLYTGQRTKQCRKLGDAICTKVYSIQVTGRVTVKLIKFAHADGFKTVYAMMEFFKKQYGLPVVLWVHEWKLVKQGAAT